MSPADTDLVTLPSAHGVTETVERLKALLAQKGIEVFAHIDHAAGAREVGLPLRPTQVLIFGNPKAGTALMQSRQTVGLDLPLRILVWEDEEGKAWLTYRRVADLARQLPSLRFFRWWTRSAAPCGFSQDFVQVIPRISWKK